MTLHKPRIALLAILLALGVTGTAQAADAQEPNNTDGTAFGELHGYADYAGSIDSTDDEDWFFLYPVGDQQLDLAVTNTSLDGECTAVYARIMEADGEGASTGYALATTSPEPGLTGHATATLHAGQKYLIEVTGSYACDPAGTPPASYVLRANAELGGEPEIRVDQPVLDRCSPAKARLAGALAKLRADRARKARAHTRRARTHARRVIRRDKRAVARARTLVAQVC
jgi:hypothetical protein